MICEQTNLVGLQFERCQNPADEKVWCPIWVSAGRGAFHLCSHHAKNFKPEFNPHAKDGEFFWGDAADEAYKRIGLTRATKF